jgi:sortase B
MKQKQEEHMKKAIITILSLFFIAVIAFSDYQLWKINEDYAEESKIHDMVLEYKPDDTHDPEQDPEVEVVNQSVIDLQGKYPDAVGWLTVPNTKIDYPFVWYKDNDYYLRRDINGKYALAGTLFMDYRCEKDFSSQNTIIYGHHMKNGSMFGTLKNFNDKAFFDANKYGTIYLPHANLTLEFFAYMVVQPTDREIYATELSETYFDYVKQKARHYRDVELSDNDRIVTLSTCSYEFNDARMVLLAKIV